MRKLHLYFYLCKVARVAFEVRNPAIVASIQPAVHPCRHLAMWRRHWLCILLCQGLFNCKKNEPRKIGTWTWRQKEMCLISGRSMESQGQVRSFISQSKDLCPVNHRIGWERERVPSARNLALISKDFLVNSNHFITFQYFSSPLLAHCFTRFSSARDDWRPESEGERSGRKACELRFFQTDFAAENFQLLGVRRWCLGNGQGTLVWKCLEDILVLSRDVSGELWLQLLRSKWLNQKNKLVGNPSHSYRRVITDVRESSDWVLHATGTQTVWKTW